VGHCVVAHEWLPHGRKTHAALSCRGAEACPASLLLSLSLRKWCSLPRVLVHDHGCMRGVCTTCDIAERCPKTCGLPMSCLRHTLRRTCGACMLRCVCEELCLRVVGHLPYCGLSLSLSLSLLSVTCACPCLPLSFCGMMAEWPVEEGSSTDASGLMQIEECQCVESLS